LWAYQCDKILGLLLFRHLTLGCLLANGANGLSDIEGKAVREASSEFGDNARVSILSELSA